jgi:nicotinate-nucleotide pyrophosphorylase (carboxylating)
MANTSQIILKIQKLFPEFDIGLFDSFTVQAVINNLSEDLSGNPTNMDLAELIEFGDVTSQSTLPPESILVGEIKAKQEGIIAGLPIAAFIFLLTDPTFEMIPHIKDGSNIKPGELTLTIAGNARKLLTAERTALNYLCHLSGVATLTRQYVDQVSGTKAKLLDTRKTIPGLRKFDKYAVLMGGGTNHRMGLFDMVLIKDNHIDGAGGITPAVEQVRKKFTDKYPIEVEVKNLQELQEALDLNVTRIMLDNMNTELMREAVEISAGRTPLEASGNVSLKTVRQIAECGVDFISVGALTHSAPAFDLSMRIKKQG